MHRSRLVGSRARYAHRRERGSDVGGVALIAPSFSEVRPRAELRSSDLTRGASPRLCWQAATSELSTDYRNIAIFCPLIRIFCGALLEFPGMFAVDLATSQSEIEHPKEETAMVPSRAALASIGFAAVVLASVSPAEATDRQGPGDFEIITLSTRPFAVSGGDVLVEVKVPHTSAQGSGRQAERKGREQRLPVGIVTPAPGPRYRLERGA